MPSFPHLVIENKKKTQLVTTKTLNPSYKASLSFPSLLFSEISFFLFVSFPSGSPSAMATAALLRSLRRRDVASASFSAYRSVPTPRLSLLTALDYLVELLLFCVLKLGLL